MDDRNQIVSAARLRQVGNHPSFLRPIEVTQCAVELSRPSHCRPAD
jgi:hypothetical protein